MHLPWGTHSTHGSSYPEGFAFTPCFPSVSPVLTNSLTTRVSRVWAELLELKELDSVAQTSRASRCSHGAMQKQQPGPMGMSAPRRHLEAQSSLVASKGTPLSLQPALASLEGFPK